MGQRLTSGLDLLFIAVLLLLLGTVLAVCDGDDEQACQPNDRTLCREGVTYWVNSCGEEGELAGHCDCGCAGDFSGCLVPCDCIPSCEGRHCGDNGCGGVCQPGCSTDEVCDPQGACCTPACDDKQCGDDGCGSTCPPGCSSGEVCTSEGNCLSCTPSCENRECGGDGCGGSCPPGCVTGECSTNGACGDYWTVLAEVASGHTQFGTVVLNDKIYVIGGNDNTSFETNRVDVYDPVANVWTTAPPMLVAREPVVVGVIDGKIYAGSGTHPDAEYTYEVFDPVTSTWSFIADATYQSHLYGAVISGKLYAMGGGVGSHDTEVEEYDPASDTWTSKTPYPTRRQGAGVAVVDDKIFLIGGGGWLGENDQSTVEMYDPQDDSWSSLPSMITGRQYVSAGVVDNRIFVIGGELAQSFWEPLDIVEVYNPETSTWSGGLTPMPTKRRGLGVAAVGRKLYAIGGNTYGTLPFTMNEVYLPPET